MRAPTAHRPAPAPPAPRRSAAALLAAGLLLACGGPPPPAAERPGPDGPAAAPAAPPATASPGSGTRPGPQAGGAPGEAPGAGAGDGAGAAPAGPEEAAPAGGEAGGVAPAPGPEPPPLAEVAIFLVLPEGSTGGTDRAAGVGPPAEETFGCGDRLVPVRVPVAAADATPAGKVAAAVRALLEVSSGADLPAHLIDALGRSHLAVERVEEAPADPGVYRLQLTGELRLGGVCDHPRVRHQLEATATQFEGVDEVEIYLDGTALDRRLSLRGEAGD